MNNTIFVSVASYRDPECQHTISSLFANAIVPERVFVGVCFQRHPTDDKHCFLRAFSHPQNVRVLEIPHTEACGPMYARHLVHTKLYQNEEYFLQIDSHSRFLQGWDNYLIDELQRCNSPMPIITTYPSAYSLPESHDWKEDAAIITPASWSPTLMCASKFDSKDGILRLKASTLATTTALQPETQKPRPGLFFAAGFCFFKHQTIEACFSSTPTSPCATSKWCGVEGEHVHFYDNNLPYLFFGEEILMSARLWTSGCDFFVPGKAVICHLWSRAHRPSFREVSPADANALQHRSLQRVRCLLGMPSSCDVDISSYPYRLGKTRSLSQYEEFCGVDFANQTISEHAFQGCPKDLLKQAIHQPTVADSLFSFLPESVRANITTQLGASEAIALVQQVSHQSQPRPKLEIQLCDPTKLKHLTQAHVELLDSQGFVVLKSFIGHEQAKAAAVAAREVCGLRPAQMGQGGDKWLFHQARGDSIMWLRKTNAASVQTEADTNVAPAIWRVVESLESVREELGAATSLGHGDGSTQLARYPGDGTGYTRHVDSFTTKARQRRISMVYYLNVDWTSDHGGQLRIYHNAEDKEQHTDIQPVLDTLVIFKSCCIEHEVLPAFAERFAIAHWMY